MPEAPGKSAAAMTAWQEGPAPRGAACAARSPSEPAPAPRQPGGDAPPRVLDVAAATAATACAAPPAGTTSPSQAALPAAAPALPAAAPALPAAAPALPAAAAGRAAAPGLTEPITCRRAGVAAPSAGSADADPAWSCATPSSGT
ncbi:hypothetical protein [Streptomyces nojiriensis]|nr:hypothetical protein [Streptomyces nojiriensis]